MLYEPVANIRTASLDTTDSEFYQYSAKRKCKFDFQFFFPLFSSFLTYTFFTSLFPSTTIISVFNIPFFAYLCTSSLNSLAFT